MRNFARTSWLPLSAAFFLLAPVASAVNIAWVTVGDPGNSCDPQDPGCFGAVSYTYRISRYETTNAQSEDADESLSAQLDAMAKRMGEDL